MAARPALKPGQRSPDGTWRWDGTQWVPSTPPSNAPSRTGHWIPWLVGGCAVLLVLAVAGAGFGIYSLLNGLQHGTITCLPGDFPKYPGATFGGINESFNAPTPGESCQVVLESSDDTTRVFDFYQGSLGEGDWRVMSVDRESGQIQFELASRPRTHGSVVVGTRAQHTKITIQLYS